MKDHEHWTAAIQQDRDHWMSQASELQEDKKQTEALWKGIILLEEDQIQLLLRHVLNTKRGYGYSPEFLKELNAIVGALGGNLLLSQNAGDADLRVNVNGFTPLMLGYLNNHILITNYIYPRYGPQEAARDLKFSLVLKKKQNCIEYSNLVDYFLRKVIGHEKKDIYLKDYYFRFDRELVEALHTI